MPGWSAASGTLLVRVTGVVDTLSAGDRVRARGFARALDPPTNPGEPDGRPSARAQGIVGRLAVDNPALIERTGRAGVWGALRRAVDALRLRAGAWLRETGDHPHAVDPPDPRNALLRAFVLGEVGPGASEVRDAFTRLGINHILAISGAHLMILALAVGVLVRGATDRPRVAGAVVLGVVLAYLLIIPARAPVVRAALMVAALTLGSATGRRHDPVTVLSWVLLAVLAWDPTQLFDLGCQLSFGVVLALLVVQPRMTERLFGATIEDGGARSWGWRRLKESVGSALCAWLVASPWVGARAGLFAPLGAVASILLVPLATVVLALAYLATAASVLSPALGGALGAPVRRLAGGLIDAALMLDALPASAAFLPRLSMLWGAGATAVVVWWLVSPGALSRRGVWAIVVVTLWTLALFWSGSRLPAGVAMRIDTLHVGDGACHLIRSGDEAVLVDCGSLRLTVGERLVPGAVRALGAARVRTLVISHPNLDHYSGVLDVVRPLGVRRVVVGEAFERSAADDPLGAPAFLLRGLRTAGVEVRVVGAGDTLSVGTARMEALSPPRGRSWRADNDASLVWLVEANTSAGPRRLLLTGDIQREAIVTLMEDRPDLRAEVMEAPHHGSAEPSAFEFVRLVDPALVIQSTGPRRLDDPRWAEARAGRTWLATAAVGWVSAEVDRSGGWTWRTMIEPRASLERLLP